MDRIAPGDRARECRYEARRKCRSSPFNYAPVPDPGAFEEVPSGGFPAHALSTLWMAFGNISDDANKSIIGYMA